MQLKEAIKKRKSIRRYDLKKPDWRKIIQALDFARFAPMAGNFFSLKFVLVKDEVKIEELRDSCQQDFVADAKYVLVVVSDTKKVEQLYEGKGEKFAQQQAGAAIQNFLLALEEQGLATCWVGYFVEDQVKQILEIPDDLEVVGFFPIGKKTKVSQKKKSRPDLDNLLYFDKWKNKYMTPKRKVGISWI